MARFSLFLFPSVWVEIAIHDRFVSFRFDQPVSFLYRLYSSSLFLFVLLDWPNQRPGFFSFRVLYSYGAVFALNACIPCERDSCIWILTPPTYPPTYRSLYISYSSLVCSGILHIFTCVVLSLAIPLLLVTCT